MQVQKIRLSAGRISWFVLNDDYLPIKPIAEFLKYLTNTEKSPNTLRAYANHLKLFWEYLTLQRKDWLTLTIKDFSLFINWLRYEHLNIVGIHFNDGSHRKISTVNTVLASVTGFYRYHNLAGNTTIKLTETVHTRHAPYKTFLHHIYKNRPTQQRLLKLKQIKDFPKIISLAQFNILFNACQNPRDQFLLMLLYETGLRIGQALNLYHTDIKSWDNVIHIIPRIIRNGELRNKTMKPNIIHVSSNLMEAYSSYVSSLEYEKTNEYVFVNLNNYAPLTYSAVRKLFLRLTKKTKIKITPHMLRHTHATDLIKSGLDASLVQKRLGHSSVQTTIDTYNHIDQDDLKNAYKKYLSDKGESNE